MSIYDAYARQRYAERRSLIDSIKLERGCLDCGFRGHPAALDFDHTDPAAKSWSIATNLSRSCERLLQEIAKCEVRCRNCHAIRTATVEGANGQGPKAPTPASLFEVTA